MKKQAKQILTICFFLGLTSLAVAQPGWNWGDSIDKAKEKNALYTDFMKAGNYVAAEKNLAWLLKNTPDLNKSIYINGASIYESLSESTADTEKLQFQSRALEMYDQRIVHFGEEAEVLNRKATLAYKFYRTEQSKYSELMALFQKAFELNGNDFYSSNLTAYMDVIRRYKLTGGKLTDDEVFEIYFKISDVIEFQIANGGDAERMEKIKEYIDKLLTTIVTVDCAFVESRLGPKFRETKDPKMAKKIFGLMLSQKCLDSPLAIEAAVVVNETEPNFTISKFLAQKYAAEGNMDKAMEYFGKAIELTNEASKKADIYMNIAKLYYSKGDKVTSRSNARKALAIDSNLSEAYKLIGDLYMNSFNDCMGGESKVKDRSVFIAAYKMYKNAGDSDAMSRAKEQFPSIEDIFNEGKLEGDIIQVNCWINESVTLERRPN
jgi:tetratricopeptide (TPR) repeat protein